MTKCIGEGLVESQTQSFHALSPWIRKQHPPGTSMWSPTRKFWCPKFLLSFHFLGMNDWNIESLANWTQYPAPSLPGGQAGWSPGCSSCWPAPILSNLSKNSGVIQGAHKQQRYSYYSGYPFRNLEQRPINLLYNSDYSRIKYNSIHFIMVIHIFSFCYPLEVWFIKYASLWKMTLEINLSIL